MVSHQNESEHRRGLVLGLTLAEIMLLLLFVLLLTLGKLVSDQTKQAEEANDKVATLKLAATKFQPILEQLEQDGKSADLSILIEKLARLNALETANKGLKADNATMRSELELVRKLGPNSAEKIAAIEDAYKAAARINPDDPPEALSRAMEIIKEVGPALDSEMMEIVREAARERERVAALSGSGEANPKVPDADKGKHKWPPIITLSEAKGHFFETGSARLSPGFRQQLGGPVADRLIEIIKDYEDYGVDIIEVIGHTDEQPLKERPSNLDQLLPDVLHGKVQIDRLEPSDNAGLGLARAVSVANLLRTDTRLGNLTILPYSGAQLIDVGDKLSSGDAPGDVRQRRRIEIRVRSSENRSAEASERQASVEQASPLVDVPFPERNQRVQKTAKRTVVGRASVVDGDTIKIHGERIRLWGIDAIEGNQTCNVDGQVWQCGRHAAYGLSLYLEGQTVNCRERNKDQYGRTVATCIARSTDVSSWLVREGLALDYKRYSGGAYAAEQSNAKREKKGVWRSTFQEPWEWRKSQRR